jgi:serine/threonine protein phosphatase PrpC
VQDSKGRKVFVWVVLDGHGGQWSVSYLAEHFRKVLDRHITAAADKEGDMKAALVDAFHEMDDALLRNMPETDSSGSTCTLLLVEEHTRRYYVANLGDSRALFVCKQGHAHPLTTDHDQHHPEERARCIAAGASVQGHYFTLKHKAKNPLFGLDDDEEELIDHVDTIMVSRSFGDRLWKEKKVMLATPEVTQRMLTSGVLYFVLCTDGVSSDFFMSWDAVADQVVSGQAVALDADHEDGQTKAVETKALSPTDRARRLVDAAIWQHRSNDNATAIVIQVHSPPSPWTKLDHDTCRLNCRGVFQPTSQTQEQKDVSAHETPASPFCAEQPLQQDDQDDEDEDLEEEELDEYDGLMEKQWKAQLGQLNRRAKHKRKSSKLRRVRRWYRSPASTALSATSVWSPVPRSTTRSTTFTRCAALSM